MIHRVGAAAFLLATAAAILTAAPVAEPRAPQATAETALAIEHWSSAVLQHTPGKGDDAVALVRAMSFDTRAQLEMFLYALAGKNAVIRSTAEQRIADVGERVRQTVGANVFLERAAVLHTDVAVLEDQTATSRPATVGHAGSSSPWLQLNPTILTDDGERVGTGQSNWNWPFARFLIDRITPNPTLDPFVGEWYHATAAYLLRHGEFNELDGHLQRAAALLPDDARILFDRACVSENFGLPIIQQLIVPPDHTEHTTSAIRPGFISLQSGPTQYSYSVNIPSEHDANAMAQQLLRRALVVDPSFVEARVRLARLLEVDGEIDEAATELARAQSHPGVDVESVVTFYAHLFASRADQSRGQLSEAGDESRAALALFPRAQSALLAQSQLALRRGDLAAARVPIQLLSELPPAVIEASDPWNLYPLGAGRNADALLTKMRGALRH